MHVRCLCLVKRIHLRETDSTSNHLRRLLDEGGQMEEFTLVDADSQTAGRGQRGNHWESEAEANLTFTLLCRPAFLPPNRGWAISEAMALAICEAIDKLPLPQPDLLRIKWPNDIYYGDRKLSGTLVECDLQGGRIGACLIGTGINVNQTLFRSEAPNPVSLKQILGVDVEREALLQRVAQAFQLFYNRLREEGAEACHDTYIARLYRRYGFHPYADVRGSFMAEVVGIEPTGHLLLRDSNGQLRRYAFKEVTFK